jgi:hypothetical protein
MTIIRWLVSLMACAMAGCGGTVSSCPRCPPFGSSSRYIDADAPPVPAPTFDAVSGQETLGELVQRLGPAHVDEGSGLYVLVWRGADGRRYYASVAHLKDDERPMGRGFHTR